MAKIVFFFQLSATFDIFLFFITQKVLIIRWFMVVFLLNGTKKLTFFNNGFIRMNMILSFLSSHYLNNYKNQNNGRDNRHTRT